MVEEEFIILFLHIDASERGSVVWREYVSEMRERVWKS